MAKSTKTKTVKNEKIDKYVVVVFSDGPCDVPPFCDCNYYSIIKVYPHNNVNKCIEDTAKLLVENFLQDNLGEGFPVNEIKVHVFKLTTEFTVETETLIKLNAK